MQEERGEIIAKIIHPFFIEVETHPQQVSLSALQQLAAVISQLIHPSHSPFLQETVSLMREEKVSLSQLEAQFSTKRSKIRLSRDLCRSVEKKRPRESVTSVTSNTSSLMIDSGEESQFESLKELYE